MPNPRWSRSSDSFLRRDLMEQYRPDASYPGRRADESSRHGLTRHGLANFLVGGLPQYLLSLEDTQSIDVNIRRHLLDEFAPLYPEPTFLLREELREIAPYHAILFAVASGHGNVPAIAAVTELPARNLHYYLQQLVNLGYLRRRWSVLNRGPRAAPARAGRERPFDHAGTIRQRTVARRDSGQHPVR